MEKQINILGSTWNIVRGTSNEFVELENHDGKCEYMSRTIYLENNVFKNLKKSSIVEKDSYRKRYKDETLRHELIHAYLYEAGLINKSHDEELVEWLTINVPKIMKLFTEMGIDNTD